MVTKYTCTIDYTCTNIYIDRPRNHIFIITIHSLTVFIMVVTTFSAASCEECSTGNCDPV